MRKVYVTIKMYDAEHGGRRVPIPPVQFGCLLLFKNINELSTYPYDCRMFFNECKKEIKPGEQIDNIPVAFLSPCKIFPHISIGTEFYIRDGGVIGEGVITSIDVI